MPTSSMDQVTQGIMQLSPNNLPQWRFCYFWATILVLACWHGWKICFPSSSWDLASYTLHLLCLALCSAQRSGSMCLLCNPFLGSARLLSAPSQPSLPSLSRSCSLRLFLQTLNLLVSLQFVKMCHGLGDQTGLWMSTHK